MSTATVRDQFLDYDLIRSGRFSANEIALLQIIITFSKHCEMKQEYLAKAMNKSIPTVRRTIKSLINKGIINRSYTVFKRCVLKVIDLKDQKKLMSAAGIIKQVLKVTKRSIKSTDRSPVSELNRSPVSEPTRNETLRNKTNKIELNFSKLAKPMTEKEYANERNRQLAAFSALFNLK